MVLACGIIILLVSIIWFIVGYIIGQMSCYGKEETDRENQEEN